MKLIILALLVLPTLASAELEHDPEVTCYLINPDHSAVPDGKIFVYIQARGEDGGVVGNIRTHKFPPFVGKQISIVKSNYSAHASIGPLIDMTVKDNSGGTMTLYARVPRPGALKSMMRHVESEPSMRFGSVRYTSGDKPPRHVTYLTSCHASYLKDERVLKPSHVHVDRSSRPRKEGSFREGENERKSPGAVGY